MPAYGPWSLMHMPSLQSFSLLCHTSTMGQRVSVSMYAFFMQTFAWTSDYNKCFLSDCFAGSFLSLARQFFACVIGKCGMTSTMQEELKKWKRGTESKIKAKERG